MACVDLEGCFQGDPLEYTDTRPEEIQELQKSIANYMGAQLGQTATTLPSGFPVAAGTNQLQTNSAQLMNQLMGGGNFGMAPYRTMGGVGGYGGGSSGGGGSSHSNPIAQLTFSSRSTNPTNLPTIFDYMINSQGGHSDFNPWDYYQEGGLFGSHKLDNFLKDPNSWESTKKT